MVSGAPCYGPWDEVREGAVVMVVVVVDFLVVV